MKESPSGLDRVVRRAELLEVLGVSAASLYRWIADGHFPNPIKLGPNSVGWRQSEVREWLESRERGGTVAVSSDHAPREATTERRPSPKEAAQ